MKIQKVLKNFNIFILLAVIIFSFSCSKNYFNTYKFYYLNFEDKIAIEKVKIDKNASNDDIIKNYLDGPINKKRFPSYFINVKSISGYSVVDGVFIINLNNDGYNIIENMDYNKIKLISKSIFNTFNNFDDIIIKDIVIAYDKTITLYNFSFSNIDK